MHAYRESLVWKQAMDLAETIYALTKQFPVVEQFGFVPEMRRSAIHIPLYLAHHTTDYAPGFLQGMTRAEQALCQLELQVWIANRLHYWSASQFLDVSQRIANIRRLFCAFSRSLRP